MHEEVVGVFINCIRHCSSQCLAWHLHRSNAKKEQLHNFRSAWIQTVSSSGSVWNLWKSHHLAGAGHEIRHDWKMHSRCSETIVRPILVQQLVPKIDAQFANETPLSGANCATFAFTKSAGLYARAWFTSNASWLVSYVLNSTHLYNAFKFSLEKCL